MVTPLDDVGKAAYARWEHRGRVHGYDRQDWLAAEAAIRFHQAYRVVVRHRFGCGDVVIGNPRKRRCRFCRQSAPAVPFPEAVAILSGDASLLALDQCATCAELFAETIDVDLRRFLSVLPDPGSISIGAFKGLVKIALAILPEFDLEDHEDTIEWVTNTDHTLDFNVFRGLSCVVSRTANPYPNAWCAVAEKIDDEAPWPSRLGFLGIHQSGLMFPIPLNPRDEDLDLTGELLPDVAPPSGFGFECDAVSTTRIPIAR